VNIKIKLAAIAKDEAAYIPEWIFHHLFFGFDCIEIWLNGTTDNSIELIEKISKSVGGGKISYVIADKLLEECKRDGLHFQRVAYQKIFNHTQSSMDFTHLFFLDLDEFWTPNDFKSPVKKAITKCGEFDALSFQWLLDFPDMKRKDFQRPFLSVNNGQKNRHIKTLIRISEKTTKVDVHTSIENGIYKLCESNIEQKEMNAVESSYFETTRNTIDNYFIYHRIYRSQREYLAHLSKGRRHTKDDPVFKDNRWGYLPDTGSSQNIVFQIDNAALTNYDNLYQEFVFKDKIFDDLNLAQSSVISRFHDVIKKLDNDKSLLVQYAKQLKGIKLNDLVDEEYRIQNLIYHFDFIRLSKDNAAFVEVIGWVYDPHSSNVLTLKVQDLSKKDLKVNIHRVPRTDVLKVHPDANLECGFKFKVFIGDLVQNLSDDNIEPFHIYGNGQQLRFPSDKSPSKIITQSLGANYLNILKNIPSMPCMESLGISLLTDRLKKTKVFLEYGAGGSTLLAAKLGVENIYSVETDELFLDAVRRKMALLHPSVKFYDNSVNIGKTKEWGFPVNEESMNTFPQYCVVGWIKILEKSQSPDLILIDGRFRVASFLVSLLLSKPKTIILFDDYCDRPHYHVVEKHLRPSRIVGRMAEFITSTNTSNTSVLFDLMFYSTNPA
jgi:hypothetical protein